MIIRTRQYQDCLIWILLKADRENSNQRIITSFSSSIYTNKNIFERLKIIVNAIFSMYQKSRQGLHDICVDISVEQYDIIWLILSVTSPVRNSYYILQLIVINQCSIHHCTKSSSYQGSLCTQICGNKKGTTQQIIMFSSIRIKLNRHNNLLSIKD